MICGLLGRTLKHSYSPKIHAMLGDYKYELFEIEPDGLDAFMQRADWHGINVTIPYKQSVIPYCAELSQTAKAIGSVNTVLRRDDGSLYGDSTDAAGFELMLDGINIKGKKILILGGGGSNLTARHVLWRHLPREVITISRSGENNYDNIDRHFDAQAIVNTTPLGMYPDVGVAAVSLSDFPYLQGVLDLIYNPARTELLLEAEQRGIACMDGLPMLVRQAAAASELFMEQEIPQTKEREILRNLRFETQNFILIGMPGSGKSTIARALAKRLERNLIDIDDELTAAHGATPAEMIAALGEDVFRKRETEMLARFGKQSELIISTGGGVVTRRENYRFLRQNGVIVFLKRPLAWLARKGRPLSQGDLQELFRKRMPMYRQFADVMVDNRGKRDDVVDEIIHKIRGVL